MARAYDWEYQQGNVIYNARRKGLNRPCRLLLDALCEWFEERPEGPTTRELADMTGLSTSAVWFYLPVLEATGWVWINRRRNGHRLPRGVILKRWPGDD